MEKEYVRLINTDIDEAIQYAKKYLHVMNPRLIEQAIRDASKTNKEYIYMITFTVDPNKHPNPDEPKIEQYIESQANRAGLLVKKFYYVRELHKDGRPHWHAGIITTRRLRQDAFIQYTKTYGKVDISRTKCTNDSEIISYLTKTGTIKHIK